MMVVLLEILMLLTFLNYITFLWFTKYISILTHKYNTIIIINYQVLLPIPISCLSINLCSTILTFFNICTQHCYCPSYRQPNVTEGIPSNLHNQCNQTRDETRFLAKETPDKMDLTILPERKTTFQPWRTGELDQWERQNYHISLQTL